VIGSASSAFAVAHFSELLLQLFVGGEGRPSRRRREAVGFQLSFGFWLGGFAVVLRGNQLDQLLGRRVVTVTQTYSSQSAVSGFLILEYHDSLKPLAEIVALYPFISYRVRAPGVAVPVLCVLPAKSPLVHFAPIINS
jgi:hypothetical protein